MKKLILLILLTTSLYAVGEAGATYLLISPGAEAAGMGEAMVAYSGTSIMSYYNPAALIFTNSGISFNRNKWLPSIFGNSHMTFLALNYNVSIEHSIGANYQYSYFGEFYNARAITLNYAYKLSDFSSISISVKQCHEEYDWTIGADEEGLDYSNNIFYDLSFFRKKNNLNFGLKLANMGKPISFTDVNQAKPAPTNLSMGLFYTFYNDEHNKLSFSFQVDKLLVTRYPMMDWDGDGYVGGYDEFGSWIGEQAGEYNIDGKKEYDSKQYYDDPWYKAIITAWLDDWYLGGDIDYDGDANIGGYSCSGGELIEQSFGEITCEGGEWVFTSDLEFSDPEYGMYGKPNWRDESKLEKGSGNNRSFKIELEEMIYKFGIEYKYTESFLLRTGYFHDKEGKVFNPTFGFGIRLLRFGFDFGYTGGKKNSSRYKTKYFTISYKF